MQDDQEERTPWSVPLRRAWSGRSSPRCWPSPARCRESGAPDAWWPAGGGVPDPLAVRCCCCCCCCEGCPAKLECLDYALAANEDGGLWGGLTRAERAEVCRQRGLAPPSPPELPRHGENSTYAAGCDCGPCTQAHVRYVADWRTRRKYAETTRSA
ncbi:WhiB family transcriptional regulator [Blastococcus montanus]|uniref:WhiB family transcriptional regulator n=1 Tax=Blastococcus montanus TaxID=3144973 RepID=UPI00387EDA86